MTARIVIRPRADRDADHHADFLGQSSLSVARRFLLSLKATYERLASMPGVGSPWESEREEITGLRFSKVDGFPHHLIFYLPLSDNEGGIEVLRVLHSASDIVGIFESGSME